VPQIIMPLAFDQLDNAARLKLLGVADTLFPKKFTGPNLTHVLGHLLANRDIADRAQHWDAEMRAHDPLTETCVELEKLGK
jgi:UDP:flavonoid glycosyltransferase YjiC (YdhE family)